ncbi:MAG: YfbU family protein [Flavobacteriaceae bacterium]|nr:YfbU family protein [Flavobacteriaceae bacterium]
MELTEKERLAFINQLQILEKLYPKDKKHFLQKRTALEKGFVYEYSKMTEFLYDELSKEDCEEVLNILEMYRAITLSLGELEEGDNLHEHSFAKFKGFDGNHEGNRMSYVKYYIDELQLYKELKMTSNGTFNSHSEMLETYQKMFKRWKELGKEPKLSQEQISTVLGASTVR